MNNSFNIPDEIFNSILKMAVEQKQQGKSTVNFNIGNMAKKSAETAKQLYDAYIEVGFTQEQAFELVKGILTAKKN